MKKLITSALVIMALPAAMASTNVSTKEVKEKKVNTDDKADELITNRRMRASNGSLSDFSVNTSLSYSGGSLDKPFTADRPNITASGDAVAVASMGGSISTTYRVTKLDRLNLGIGVTMVAPFHDTIDTADQRAQNQFDDNQGELQVNNPSFSYTHMNKFFGVQTIFNVGITHFTAGTFTDAGYDNRISASINTMYDVGQSGFSFGALAVFDRNLFDRDDEELLAGQNETVFGFLPQAEYVINDTFNLRTIVRSNWYQNNRAQRRSAYFSRPVTQSVGLGISINRDVFLYPNIQFAYKNFQASNTNVGLSANINMF